MPTEGIERSIGPDDQIIVEGVPALLSPVLRSFADASLFVDVDDAVRRERLVADYRWRGQDLAEVESRLVRREHDEVSIVRASIGNATLITGE
jgi:uridine kinase